MQRLAQFLAREMEFDLQAALDRPVDRYRADIFGTREQGAELRRLTVEACFLHDPHFDEFAAGTTTGDILVADDLTLTATASPEMVVLA